MSGMFGYIGLKKQTTLGTGVTPDVFLPATESLGRKIARLRDENPWGGRDDLRSDAGRKASEGALSGVHGYPEEIGHLLMAFFGQDTPTGSGPYTHVFDRRTAPISAVQPLPAYTIQREIDGNNRHRFVDSYCKSFSLNAPADNRITIDTEWISRDWINGPTALTPAAPTTLPFKFKHAAHKRATVAYNLIETLTINGDNGLEVENLQDGTDIVAAVFLGRAKFDITAVIAARDTQVAADFNSAFDTPVAWEFAWVSGTKSLKFIIPKLALNDDPRNLSGVGRQMSSVTATAEIDSILGYACRVELVNSQATY
jgi:hypothetical protein